MSLNLIGPALESQLMLYIVQNLDKIEFCHLIVVENFFKYNVLNYRVTEKVVHFLTHHIYQEYLTAT